MVDLTQFQPHMQQVQQPEQLVSVATHSVPLTLFEQAPQAVPGSLELPGVIATPQQQSELTPAQAMARMHAIQDQVDSYDLDFSKRYSLYMEGCQERKNIIEVASVKWRDLQSRINALKIEASNAKLDMQRMKSLTTLCQPRKHDWELNN